MEVEYRKSFTEALEGSKPAQLAVQEYALSMGLPCVRQPAIMVPPGGNPENYKDGGDLFFQMRAEVKHNPDCHWFNADDYPYPDILICRTDSFDDQPIKPRYYFIVNGDISRAAVIDVFRTEQYWTTWPVFDGRPGRGYEYPAYHIQKDREEVAWITL